MPTYLYRILAEPQRTFEVIQSIHDAALTRHPETGQAVERVICPPVIGRGRPGDAEIRNAGLTKLMRRSDGSYTPS